MSRDTPLTGIRPGCAGGKYVQRFEQEQKRR